MKKIYKNAGIRIRFLREERHYTREYLAEMADIYEKLVDCLEKRLIYRHIRRFAD